MGRLVGSPGPTSKNAPTLALTAAPVFAEDFHCPKPGTAIGFSGGGVMTFAEQDGMFCVAKNVKGNTVRTLFGIGGPNSAFAKNHGERLFPFKVGNEVEFDYTADSSHMSASANP